MLYYEDLISYANKTEFNPLRHPPIWGGSSLQPVRNSTDVPAVAATQLRSRHQGPPGPRRLRGAGMPLVRRPCTFYTGPVCRSEERASSSSWVCRSSAVGFASRARAALWLWCAVYHMPCLDVGGAAVGAVVVLPYSECAFAAAAAAQTRVQGAGALAASLFVVCVSLQLAGAAAPSAAGGPASAASGWAAGWCAAGVGG